MKPILLTIALGLAFGAATLPARAQEGASGQARSGGYGGGFLELLITGRDPVRPSANPVLGGRGERRRLAGIPRPTDLEPAEQRLDEPGVIGRGLDPRFQRQEVSYSGPDAPGTIVVDTPSKFLYHVQAGGRAVRYGIGVGRPGFKWAGTKTVSMKREWPGWTPPPEMLARRPELPRHMEGGPANPLGARALYLGSSLYRIHGTNEPHTIGQNVSSGCIRMMNEDVIDLYDQVRVGAIVKVI